jgi:hypothetical protein
MRISLDVTFDESRCYYPHSSTSPSSTVVSLSFLTLPNFSFYHLLLFPYCLHHFFLFLLLHPLLVVPLPLVDPMPVVHLMWSLTTPHLELGIHLYLVMVCPSIIPLAIITLSGVLWPHPGSVYFFSYSGPLRHLLCVLWYLCGTISHLSFFPCSSSLQPRAYSNATWSSDHFDHHSLLAYCVFLGSLFVVSCLSVEPKLQAIAVVTMVAAWGFRCVCYYTDSCFLW